MREYVKYLERVFAELLKLPPEQFNKKMDELSHPSVREFLSRPVIFSDEPVVYCYPSPRAYMKLVENMKDE